MLDTKVIREYFPYLQDNLEFKVKNPNQRRIAVDNTASTQLSLPVLECLVSCLFDYANVHRGEYTASLKTSESFERAYNVAANFINAKSWREIIFGRNTTEMINLVMRVIEEDFRDGDNIVLTRMEHNSNYVPWYGLQSILSKREPPQNVEIRVVNFDPVTGELYMNELESKVDERTKLVTVSGGSNFLGVRPDIKRIGEIAHQSGYEQPGGTLGSYFLVDGAQLVPGAPVDVQDIDCDFLAWSFHKMAIPMGVGALYTRSAIIRTLPPFLYGGDMIEEVAEGDVKYKKRPWLYTAGTPNILGTIASGKGLCFLISLGNGNLFIKGKTCEEDKIDCVGRAVECEILLNTPRGDIDIKYEVPEELKPFWEDYLSDHPEVEVAIRDENMRLAGVRRMVNRAMNNIKRHEEELVQRAIDGLSKIPLVSIYGPLHSSNRVGLVAFNIEGLTPEETARRLDAYGVEVRSGTHCACLAHRYIGIEGSVRMSFYVYNDPSDVDNAVWAVGKVAQSVVKDYQTLRSAKKVHIKNSGEGYVESGGITEIRL